MNELNATEFHKWKARLELLATILLVLVTLMIGGFWVVDRLRPAESRASGRGIGVEPVPSSVPPIPLAGASVKGNPAAKVALVVFSDFECPVCARAERELMPELTAKYIDTGKVLFVWRHYPLPIHSSARRAAEAAECAGHQGKFWELHDWAFAHSSELSSGLLRGAAERIGMDMPAYERCTGGEVADKVTGDVALASRLGVGGTPTWFVGTLRAQGAIQLVSRISGLGPAESYGRALESALQLR